MTTIERGPASQPQARGRSAAAAGAHRHGADPLATFDVFETVLVRSVSPAQAVFDVLGARAAEAGLITCSPQAFSRARVRAEQRALSADPEGTGLAEIHAELGATLGLTAAAQERLAELEMATEADLLHPVPAVLPRLREARKAAGRVVFVSDMYLPAEFITEQLRRHGAWCEGDALYVAHAHRTSKRSGTLFAAVAASEGVRPRDLRHHGNDDDADVRAARRAGAQGVLLPDGNPGRFELILQQHRETTDGLSAAMAGASRLARLDVRAWTSRERALIEVAAGVLAPVLTTHLAAELRHARAAESAELTFTDDAPGRTLMRLAVRLGPDLPLRIKPGTRLTDDAMPRGRRRVLELCAPGLAEGGPRDTARDREVVRRTVDAYLTHLDPAAWSLTTHLDLTAPVDEVTNLFWAVPTREEVHAWTQLREAEPEAPSVTWPAAEVARGGLAAGVARRPGTAVHLLADRARQHLRTTVAGSPRLRGWLGV